MSKLTENEVRIIKGMLYEQEESILSKVNLSLESFRQDNRENFTALNKSVRILADLASSAKGTAEKVQTAIEGNGAIGLKTQVRNNHTAIQNLSQKIDCSEKESLKNQIRSASKSGALKERKYDRRSEDIRSKRKDFISLIAVGLTVISGIIIQFIASMGGR